MNNTMKEKKYYVKCTEVREGMFSSERAVAILDASGRKITGIFDFSRIKGGYLEVDLIAQQGDAAVVSAINNGMGQGFYGSSGEIWVNKKDLVLR